MEIAFFDATGRHGRVHVKSMTVNADEDAENPEIEIKVIPTKDVRGGSVIRLIDLNYAS